MGTPAYMSPEQWEGEPADARSDLFSFGLILFEMAAGRRPFPGASAGKILATGQAASVPVREARQFLGPLADVIGGLLRRDPDARTATAAEVASELSAIASGNRKGRPFRTLLLVAAAVIAVVILAGLYKRFGDAGPAAGARSLAIFAFQNRTGDESKDALAGGLTASIQTDLAAIGSLRLVTAPKSEPGKAPLEIARNLGVEAIVEGTLDRAAAGVAFTAKITNTATGGTSWSRQFQGSTNEFSSLQRQASEAIAGAIRVSGNNPAVEPRPVNGEAYELYLRGKFHSGRDNEPELDRAIAFFEQSAALDPNHSATYAELARALGNKAFYYQPNDPQWEEKTFAALQRALALDPNSADSHFARGFLLWRPSHSFPNREALGELQAATTARPNFDEAWHQQGMILFHIGHMKAARAAIDRALSINPNNTQARFRYGPILIYEQRFEEAIDALNRVPRTVNPHQWVYQMAWSMLTVGRRQEAEDLLLEEMKTRPADQGGVMHAARGMLRAMEGNRRAAEADIADAIRLGKNFGHFHHTAYSIGAIYSVLGDYDKAQRWIEMAANDGFPNYRMFENDPHLKGARTSPKFRAYLAKLRAEWQNVNGDIE